MKLYKTTQGIIIQCDDKVYLSQEKDWDYYINQDNLHEVIEAVIQTLNEVLWDYEGILAPIGHQEVWASGVTYMRSREARMEESQDSNRAPYGGTKQAAFGRLVCLRRWPAWSSFALFTVNCELSNVKCGLSKGQGTRPEISPPPRADC